MFNSREFQSFTANLSHTYPCQSPYHIPLSSATVAVDSLTVPMGM